MRLVFLRPLPHHRNLPTPEFPAADPAVVGVILFDALILTDARCSLARAVVHAAVRLGGNSD